MDDKAAAERTKRTALLGLAAAAVITVASWFFIDSATDRGLARLDYIERVYAVCKADYAKAMSGADTSRVDAQALSALIDSGKAGAPTRCGELRRRDGLAAQD